MSRRPALLRDPLDLVGLPLCIVPHSVNLHWPLAPIKYPPIHPRQIEICGNDLLASPFPSLHTRHLPCQKHDVQHSVELDEILSSRLVQPYGMHFELLAELQPAILAL
mmetsp:Transcript_14495/g.46861  ORF Transcript_14495/g.46861 Transcript_14495/m.46861 type:complete len:108 (-) Transcript_14495:1364-1687(-)